MTSEADCECSLQEWVENTQGCGDASATSDAFGEDCSSSRGVVLCHGLSSPCRHCRQCLWLPRMFHPPSAPAVRSPALLPCPIPKRWSSWKSQWSQKQTAQNPDARALFVETCFSFLKKQLPSYARCCHLASFTVRHLIALHSYKELFERWEHPPPQHYSTVSPTQAASCLLIAVIVTQGEH